MEKRKIEYLDIKTLIPYVNNARTHNDEQIKQIAASIKEFGFTNPVLIDKDNGIVAGHGRVQGARLLGMEEVPCIRLEYMTEAQKKAYIIADNKLALNAGWDEELLKLELDNLKELNFDLDLLGFSTDELDKLFQMDKEAEEDGYEVILPAEPTSKYGDVYKLGNHTLMCGDSTLEEDVDILTGHEVMDLCLTDPPYNVDYGGKAEMLEDYDKGHTNTNKIMNDNMSESSFYTFLFDFYKQMLRSLRKGGAYYVFHSDSEGYNFRKALRDNGNSIRQTLIWVKNTLVLGRQDYQWKHEPILYGWKDKGTHYFTSMRSNDTVIEDNINFNKMNAREMRELLKQIFSDKTDTTILHEDKPTKNDMHPTMKPIKLCGRLIKNSTAEGHKVIDFFGGSGSTLMACEQLERTCYIMELDPKYVDVIIDRWEKFTGLKASKIREIEKR